MITEDLGMFLDDHGVPCSSGGINFDAVLEMPGEMVSVGGRDVISTSYALTAITSDITDAGLKYGAAVKANGINFTVREVFPLDDGSFSQINLTKV